MADINYLYYGDQQVDQQALMNKMANEVNQYVQSQPWTRKRKDMFMSAYSDIMNNGLKGMSNNTGQWMVDFGGPTIDWNSKSRKEKEMYEEAGYFIQQQMSGLAIEPKKEEEKIDKKELTKFKNEDFVSSFTNRLVNDWFGGNVTNYSNQWNDYDERGENGLRGIGQRAEMLATSLRNYLGSLKDDQYDFTDSPFVDINDFKTKVQTAINTLESDNKDLNQIKKSLNVIGLNADEWFNNGSGDPYVDEYGRVIVGSDGKPLSYAEYYNNLALQEKLKQETEQKATEEKQEALDALQIYTSRPHQKLYSFSDLSKYGDTNSFLNDFKDKQIQDLSQEESDKLLSYFYNLKGSNKEDQYLEDLTDEEWEPLKSKLKPIQSQYGYGTIERNKNQFKKAKGLNGIYYDTVQNTLVSIGQQEQKPLEDLFSGLSDKEREEAYLNSKIPGVTNAEWKELSAIAADIISIIDPEPFTAGGLGIAAAELRRRALNETPGHKWGFWDIVGQGVDYATGALASIPGFGDATLAAKLATKISPTLRIVGRLGAWKDLYDSLPGLKAAYDKAVNGEELTIKDWRLIGQGIRGLVTHGRMSKANLAERKILTESGYTPEQVSGMRGKAKEYMERTGFARTKVPKETTTSTIKVEKNGKTEEIPITENQKSLIEAEVKKAGNDTSKRNSVVEKVLKEQNLITESDKITVEAPIWRDNQYIPLTGTSSKLFGSQTTSATRGNDNFENWLSTRGTASRLFYGTDQNLRRMRNWMGITDETPQNSLTQSSSEASPNTSATTSKPTNQTQQNTSTRESQYRRAVMNRYKDILSGNYSKKAVQEGTFKFNDIEVEIKKSGTGTNDIYINGKRVDSIKDLSDKEVKQHIAKLVQEHRTSVNKGKSKEQKISTKEIGKILQELKKKGWLKHGGQITDTQIDNFLKQYKI